MMLRLAAFAMSVALTMSAHATIHAVAPGEMSTPSTIAVALTSGDSATFRLSNGTVTDIVFRVADKPYLFPLVGCAPIKDIHFETVVLDSDLAQRTEGTFTLRFRMGDVQSRQFGEFPAVQITFFKGKPSELLVAHWTGINSSFWTPLCAASPGA
jgi:hypothetical protein